MKDVNVSEFYLQVHDLNLFFSVLANTSGSTVYLFFISIFTQNLFLFLSPNDRNQINNKIRLKPNFRI
jgi:hypothetical protein